LQTVAKLFTSELNELQNNGFTDEQGNTWLVEFFFSADWKFLALVKGFKSAIANNSCLYCECHKNERYDMEHVWTNSHNTKGIYTFFVINLFTVTHKTSTMFAIIEFKSL